MLPGPLPSRNRGDGHAGGGKWNSGVDDAVSLGDEQDDEHVLSCKQGVKRAADE
jgi:hypothetical protein